MKRKLIVTCIVAAIVFSVASLGTSCSRVGGVGSGDETKESNSDAKELTSEQIRDILAAAMAEDKHFTKENIDSVKTEKFDDIVEDCKSMDEENIKAYVERLGQLGLKKRTYSEVDNESYPRIRDEVLGISSSGERVDVESIEKLLKQCRSSLEFCDKLSVQYGSADYSYRYSPREGGDQYWLDDTGDECIVLNWTLYESESGDGKRDFIINGISLSTARESWVLHSLYNSTDLNSIFKDEIRYYQRCQKVERVLRKTIGENESYFGEGASQNLSDFVLHFMLRDCQYMKEAQVREYIERFVKDEIKIDVGCGAGAGYPRICAEILGDQSADMPRLTTEAYDKLAKEIQDPVELRDKIHSQYGSPDYFFLFSGRYGGMEEYWLDDKGTEKISLELN